MAPRKEEAADAAVAAASANTADVDALVESVK